MPGEHADLSHGGATWVPEDALAQVNAACASLVRGGAVALVEARCALEAAVAIIEQSREAVPQAPMVPWTVFHRAVKRAGQLLGAIGKWQWHRHALLFPEQTDPSYGANGRQLSAPAAASLTLKG